METGREKELENLCGMSNIWILEVLEQENKKQGNKWFKKYSRKVQDYVFQIWTECRVPNKYDSHRFLGGYILVKF